MSFPSADLLLMVIYDDVFAKVSKTGHCTCAQVSYISWIDLVIDLCCRPSGYESVVPFLLVYQWGAICIWSICI